MTDNLKHKANACRADLSFLLSIIPRELLPDVWKVREAIASLKHPTEQKITAAWQLAATIHEKIRKNEKEI